MKFKSQGSPLLKKLFFQVRPLLKLICVFLAYLSTAKLGLALGAVEGFASLVWAPTGVALAALLLWGRLMSLAVFLAAFAANWNNGAPLSVSLGIGLGNTLESLFALYLLRGMRRTLDSVRDVVSFVVFGVLASPAIGATVGTLSLNLAGLIHGSPVNVWFAWWFGDAMGVLIVAPLFFILPVVSKLKFSVLRFFESAVLALVVLGLCLLGFVSDAKWISSTVFVPYAFFPVILWAAVRFVQAGAILTNLTIAIIAIWGTVSGLGIFSNANLVAALLDLQIFLMVAAFTGLGVAALVGDRLNAVRARDEFLSIASHELKTPVTTLKLQMEILYRILQKTLTGESYKQTERSVALSSGQLDRLVRLIDDLLDVSRIQTGRFNLQKETVKIAEFVEDVVRRFTADVFKADLLVDASVGRTTAQWDPLRVEQAIVNLLSNAVKYAPGKPVQVAVELKNDKAYISVIDRGPGIPKDKQEKIFERFERVAVRQAVGGLGLGLYITRQIATGHDGRVLLASDPEHGSRFTLELPI